MRRSSVFVNKCAVDPDRVSVDSLNIPERDRKSQSLDRKSSSSGLDFKRTFSLTLKKPNRDHEKRPLPPLPPSLNGVSPAGPGGTTTSSTPQCCSNNGALGVGSHHRRTKSNSKSDRSVMHLDFIVIYVIHLMYLTGMAGFQT